MSDQLIVAVERLERTLSTLDETMRTAQADALRAAGDAARAAETIAKEKWWRRVTLVLLLLLSLAVSIGWYDTREDQQRDRERARREEDAACLRANEARGNIRDAIVAALQEIYAASDSASEAQEQVLVVAVRDRVRTEIPLRECEQ